MGRQARDRPARDAAGREALTPVAPHLENRLQPVLNHLAVGIKRQDAPDRPALAIVVEGLRRDRNCLGAVGRARCHGEHEHFGAPSEESVRVPLAHPVDVRLVPIVAADRYTLAEIGRRADLAKEMVAAEPAIGMPRQAAHQQVSLNLARRASLVEKCLGQPARA